MKAGVVPVKKFISVLLALELSFSAFLLNASSVAIPTVSAKSAVVMIASTGQILYEKNAYEKRGMASTTKILTSVTALENANVTDKIKASFEAVNVEGTSAGIKSGDEIDLLTLIKAMLLESGNDAANVTAELVSGNKEDFSRLMNKTAQRIGMLNSSFKNPSGLTEEGHYSCAYDMALLGSYAVKNSFLRSICSLKQSKVTFGNPKKEVTYYNHNKLLSKYDGAFGIKTGFTKASGRCLVSAVERNGITLVCVTLNAYDDWNDHIKLYDYCFPMVSVEKADIDLTNIKVRIVNSSKKELSFKLSRDIYIPYAQKSVKYGISFYIPRFLYAGINKGDYVGWVELHTESGILIDKVYLLADEKADALKYERENKQTLIEKILKFTEKDRR